MQSVISSWFVETLSLTFMFKSLLRMDLLWDAIFLLENLEQFYSFISEYLISFSLLITSFFNVNSFQCFQFSVFILMPVITYSVIKKEPTTTCEIFSQFWVFLQTNLELTTPHCSNDYIIVFAYLMTGRNWKAVYYT